MCTNHMGMRLIGVANKTPYLGGSWALPNDLKRKQVFRRCGLICFAYECLDLKIWRFLSPQTTDDRHVRTRGDYLYGSYYTASYVSCYSVLKMRVLHDHHFLSITMQIEILLYKKWRTLSLCLSQQY
jgi:hypothetical protein